MNWLKQAKESDAKIKIHKSETADTRTCNVEEVSKEQLIESTKSHQSDVKQAIGYFCGILSEAAERHDFTKIDSIDDFYKDFQNEFKTQDWYDMHKKEERHHLDSKEGVRKDVDLIDVLEHIADCVMAGMARSGKVTQLKLSNEVLQKAFKNTVNKLKDKIEVIEEDELSN